jgi:shikimate kinase
MSDMNPPYRVFLAGYPGTGKTTTGDHFYHHYHWRHIDVERLHILDDESWKRFQLNPIEWVENASGPRQPVIASWGFIPQFGHIARKFEEAGYTMVYFYGYPDWCLANIRERDGKEPASGFQRPAGRAKRHVSRWYDVDVFRLDGTMYTTEHLASRVMAAVREVGR